MVSNMDFNVNESVGLTNDALTRLQNSTNAETNADVSGVTVSEAIVGFRAREGRCVAVKVAPISTIPPEIIAKIFEAVCFRKAKPQSRPAEVIISQVNRHLRMVALATSSLWSRIHVDDTKTLTNSLKAAWTYLLRSKSHPIVLEIKVNIPIQALAKIFAPHLHRCTSLTVHSTDREFWDKFASCLEFIVKTPMLKEMHLDYRPADVRNPGRGDVPMAFLSSQNFPNIQELSLNGFPIIPQIGLHDKLRSLSLYRMEWRCPLLISYTTLWEILNGHATLKSLLFVSVVFCWDLVDDNTVERDLFLPALDELTLDCFGMIVDFAVILRYLRAPVLDALTIKGSGFKDLELHLDGVAEGALSTVRWLTLHFDCGEAEENPEDVKLLLHHLSRICNGVTHLELSLESMGVFVAFIQESPQAWKGLRTLAVTYFEFPFEEPEEGENALAHLRQILNLRAQAELPIRVLEWDYEVKDTLEEGINELKAATPEVKHVFDDM